MNPLETHLLNEIISEAVKGIQVSFKVTHWDASFDGHPKSATVTDARLTLHGPQMLAAGTFAVAEGFAAAGGHTLSGAISLPLGPSNVVLDGEPVSDGKLVLVPVVKGRKMRVEVLFFCPTVADPLRHFRMDGDLVKL